MAFRVTQQTTIQTALWHLNAKQTELAHIQDQVGSLKQINQPSDDPSGTARVLNLRTQTAHIERFIQNISTIRDIQEVSASALQSCGDLIVSAKQIVISAANSTVDQDTRAVMAGQIEDVLKSIVQLANTKHRDTYLFSGTATDTKPFDITDIESANPVTYNGNGDTCKQFVDFQTKVDIYLSGSQVFHTGEDGDVFATLSEVRQLLLNSGGLTEEDQIAQLSAIAEDLTDAHNQILNKVARQGSQSQRMDTIAYRLEDEKLLLGNIISETEDADIAELITKLKEKESALQAALMAAGQIIRPSLMQFLQ